MRFAWSLLLDFLALGPAQNNIGSLLRPKAGARWQGALALSRSHLPQRGRAGPEMAGLAEAARRHHARRRQGRVTSAPYY